MKTNSKNNTGKHKADKMWEMENLLSQLSFETHRVTDHDVDEAWNSLRPNGFFNPKKSGRHLSSTYLIAATVVLFVLAFVISSVVWMDSSRQLTDNKGVQVEKSTLNGQKLTFVLPDGSKVVLNAGSTLKYSKVFGQENLRQVFLDGEAFFDVVHDPKSPFVVVADKTKTTVLGTQFNVNSYSNNTETKIALVKGAVNVKNTDSELKLTPGHMVIFDNSNHKTTISAFDFDQQIAWKEGVLVCNHESLTSLTVRLERWYGVTIEVAPDAAINSNWRYHGKFRGKSLAYILEALSYPDHFKYRIVDKKVTIY
ncbi:FecR domain-containing protein [Gilvimarinus agarilyticus]|nr:FecR domain-containing protein [Gilvimarinus agarilyticus]